MKNCHRKWMKLREKMAHRDKFLGTNYKYDFLLHITLFFWKKYLILIKLDFSSLVLCFFNFFIPLPPLRWGGGLRIWKNIYLDEDMTNIFLKTELWGKLNLVRL